VLGSAVESLMKGASIQMLHKVAACFGLNGLSVQYGCYNEAHQLVQSLDPFPDRVFLAKDTQSRLREEENSADS